MLGRSRVGFSRLHALASTTDLAFPGLKRMDTGALVKDYETAENEDFAPVQLVVREVEFEDERYLEQDAPPLDQEYPVGSRAIFLGANAYGVAAQVTEVKDKSMTVDLAVSRIQ